MKDKTAYFVKLPFSIENLKVLHLYNKRKPFIVEKVIELSKIDYENLITDLTVERWYIGKNKGLCFIDEDGVWHCLLMRKRGCQDGVLVMSEGTDYPMT
jgi:hypothetical protein